MKRVFVSYSRRNKMFAERIARDLSDAGLDVWIDFRQIQGGELWQSEIYRGIDRSEMLVFCLSPESVSSEWCRREVNTAHEQKKYIIPVMLADSLKALEQQDDMRWMLDVHIINFDSRYEEAFPELLDALPGLRRVGVYDDVDPANIPNPFKGLESFQQTDASFFFGRENLITKSLRRLREDGSTRFLAVVGASGSGKSSLVRAGIIPKIRGGDLPGSDQWPVIIFTPGTTPVEALATRLIPLLRDDRTVADIATFLENDPANLDQLTAKILDGAPETSQLLLVVDQFEEVFTRASDGERETFLKLMHHAVTVGGGRTLVIITMRADFFGRLSQYPDLAELFEQENMIIATEMTAASLLRSIEGPARAVGLVYDEGLTARILEDVRRQPGSLPLLQYALQELYKRRVGRRLTTEAYDEIGGVQRALAQHAEDIYSRLNAAQQGIARRLLLRLVEVGDSGEATRRRVPQAELTFRDVSDEAVQEVIDLLTAADARLLVASREIRSSEDEHSEPVIWIDVSHEALIREWDRFKGWVTENTEALRYGSELLKLARDWDRGSRDEAYLLTGNRLLRAEVWLETADATALQREYIQASVEERKRVEQILREQQARELALQKRSTNRLRLFVAVLVISLVGAIGLTLIALDSQERATKSANAFGTAVVVADHNAEQANSLARAASADRALGDGNTELALALAVEAASIASPPPQAQYSLSTAAYAPGIRRLFGTGDDRHTDAVNSLVVSRNGYWALSGSSDNSLILWNVNDGTVVRRFGGYGADGHTAAVRSVAFSPDNKLVASGSDDNTVILWDVETGELLRRLEGHTAPVRSVAFSPDGRSIVSASEDTTLILWDVADGMIVQHLTGYGDAVYAVAFNPDGRTVLSGSSDGALMLWDVVTGIVVRTFGPEADDDAIQGHKQAILSVAFSPDGKTAASGSADDSAILWDVGSGTPVRQYLASGGVTTTTTEQLDQGGNIFSIAFSPEGGRLVAGTENGRIIVWDVDHGIELLSFVPGSGVISGAHQGDVLAVSFTSDGQHILSGGDDGQIIMWDTEQAELIRRFMGFETNVLALAYSPDGRTIASGSQLTTDETRGDLRLWDVNTGRIIQEFSGQPAKITTLDFSADGTLLLAGDQGGNIILWDVETGQQIRAFANEQRDPIYTIVFTPDGSRALSTARDGALIEWDVETGEAIRTLTGHAGSVFGAAISPDGTRALSGDQDGTVILWNLETGEAIQSYENHRRLVWSVAFSDDGQQGVSGSFDGEVVLWNLDTGQEIRRFSGHRKAVRGVAFSTGNTVLSVSLDGSIRLWDVDSGFEIRRYQVEGQNNSVLSMGISPDGATVATGLGDKSFRIWRVLPHIDQLLSWTMANRYVPELDCSQREQFDIEPACDAAQTFPTHTPFPLPTVTATSDYGRLVIGGTATVNTTLGQKLNLRDEPGLTGSIIGTLESGAQVTLLDGPRRADGLAWWQVQTADGDAGWVVEASQDNVQTLLP